MSSFVSSVDTSSTSPDNTLSSDYHYVVSFPEHGLVHLIAVSTDGCWLLSSSSSRTDGNLITLTNAQDFLMCAVLDSDSIWMTCAVWASSDVFIAGFSNGDVCAGRITDRKSLRAHKLFSLSLAGGAITALAFHRESLSVAAANAREVILVRTNLALAPERDVVIGRLKPFDMDSSITCLSLYLSANGLLGLVVGASKGLAFYVVEANKLCPIYKTREYNIGHCLTVDDGRYIIISTVDGRLIRWKLRYGSPLQASIGCFSLNGTNGFAPPIATTSIQNNIVAGTAAGDLYYLDWVTMEDCGGVSCRRWAGNMISLASHGHRLYIGATSRRMPGNSETVCYTRSITDLSQAAPVVMELMAKENAAKVQS
ncbi:hypothetical protein RhiJN_27242 [Ceratobasidium sp. AG-Ba]|nr:hypothetical protein RhiJN_27242 [Ceratobasidium sp. AG-Ba]QRW13721.1 hypothetical protein RhiLY_12720 [Ceratobasidium sp. AG-Ba]